MKSDSKSVKIENEDIKVIRKSFDGRWKKAGQPKFVYTVDVNVSSIVNKKLKLIPIQGRIEKVSDDNLPKLKLLNLPIKHPEIVIVGNLLPITFITYEIINSILGAGPAGLFAAISCIERGLKPIIIEKGKVVELRGQSIGALFNRKILDPDSNLCYGEGGAGTW